MSYSTDATRTPAGPRGAVIVALSLAASLGGVAFGAAAAATQEPPQTARVKVGDTAVDFSLPSIDGQTYRLSDVRGEKTAIVIFFRGTW